MAEQVIDTLKLEIEANSSNAEKSVERLATSLLGLNQSIKKISNNVGGMRKVFSSLSNLSTLKLPDFGRTLEQLKEMSKIDFKNLENKKLNVELKINGASEAEKMQVAIHEATNAVKEDAKVIAKELQQAFKFSPSETKKLQKQLEEMGSNIARTDFGGDATYKILETLKSNRVTNQAYEEYFSGVGDGLASQYQNFIEYIRKNKINVKDIVSETGFKTSGQTWGASNLRQFVSKNAPLLDENYFNDIINLFPELISDFQKAANQSLEFETDFDGVTKKVVACTENMSEVIRKTLVGAMEYLNTKTSESNTGKYIDEYFGREVYQRLTDSVNEAKNKYLNESSSKVPIDIVVDTNKIISQIEKAVNEAKSKNYGTIDVKLEVATDILRNQLKTALSGIEPKDFTNMASALRDMSRAFVDISSVKIGDTGIDKFAKGIASLNGATFDPTGIQGVTQAVSGFATQDFSRYNKNITSLISSLSSLARVDTTPAISGIQQLLDVIKSFAMTNFSRFNGDIAKFVSGLGHLANAKIDTANNDLMLLIETVRDFAGADFSSFNKDINGFVNALKNLARTDLRKYSSRLNSFLVDIRRIAETDMSMFNETMIGFVNALKNLVNAGNKGIAVDSIKSLSEAVRDFIASMSSIDVSDNTVRMAEALAQLAQNSRRAKHAMEDMTGQVSGSGKQLNVVTVAIDSIKDSFSTLTKILRKFGKITVSAIGGLVSKIKELATHQPKIDNVGYSFKNLLKTVIGFKGLTGVFNWMKESVDLGAEITEIDHIVESVFGEDMVGYINEWATNTIDKFGIASNSAKKYAGTLSAMFQASNVAIRDSNQMALKLTELAGKELVA